jgi:hypothetical protein
MKASSFLFFIVLVSELMPGDDSISTIRPGQVWPGFVSGSV